MRTAVLLVVVGSVVGRWPTSPHHLRHHLHRTRVHHQCLCGMSLHLSPGKSLGHQCCLHHSSGSMLCLYHLRGLRLKHSCADSVRGDVLLD